MTIFDLKMMVKSGLDFFFEIERAPSEIPANLPGQFSLSRPIFLHWAAATLKGLIQLLLRFTDLYFSLFIKH